MGILRLITVILGVGMLALVVLSAGMTFMPGTKIGHVFTLPPETPEGNEPGHPKTMTMAQWVAAHREHPLDGLTTQLACNLPAFVLGIPLGPLAMVAAFRGMWGAFIHSNLRLPLGPLGFLFGAPELHHWHHARVEQTRHNFANLAPYMDWIFGTYHRPVGEEQWALGLSEPFPRGYLGQLVSPLRALVVSVREPQGRAQPVRESGAQAADRA